MKRMILLMMGISLIVSCAQAAPVTERVACQVACAFWNTHRPADVKPVDTMLAVPFDVCGGMYVFSAGETGYVIVSADDRVRPILGYSFEEPFARREVNPALAMWLKGYAEQIAAASESDAPADPRWSQWATKTVPDEPVSLQHIPKLVKTRWDQTEPYNRLCPYDSNVNDRAVVGCVATAMAQIMKYWNYPSSGAGSHSYEPYSQYNYGTLTADFEHTPYLWSQMPNMMSASASDAEALGVATLSYHCGVAVNMMYGTVNQGGSAAYSSCYGPDDACAVSAFRNYFKYNERLEFHDRYGFDDSTWRSMIDAELALGHPLYYNGHDASSGHAFILDGSDLDTHYHFNWGWSGYGDGYYAIDNLAPGGGGAGSSASHTYNLYQGAIFGIVPLPETFDTVELYDTVCSGSSYYRFREYSLPVATCDTHLRYFDTVFFIHVKRVGDNLLTFHPNSNAGDPFELQYCYRDSVQMPECPYSVAGFRFRGWCKSKRGTSGTIYRAGEMVKLKGNMTLYAQWVDSSAAGIQTVESEAVRLWPNPTTGELNITLAEGVLVQVTVTDALGRTVGCEKFAADAGSEAKISIKHLPVGLYTLQVQTSDGICKRRVIKR